VSERLGHASTSITANLYQHVLPSMDERTANAVANLILGDRKPDAESAAVNPLSTGPQVHEAKREVKREPQLRGGAGGAVATTLLPGLTTLLTLQSNVEADMSDGTPQVPGPAEWAWLHRTRT
jgi:hypothetical protein